MMKNSRSDLNRLLGGLLIFCVVTALFYTGSEKKDSPNPSQAVEVVQSQTAPALSVDSLLQEPSLQEIMHQLLPLLKARSIKKVVELLQDVPLKTAADFVLYVLRDSDLGLSAHQKVALLLGIAHNFQANEADQNKILDLIPQFIPLFKDSSLLYAAADNDYAPLMSRLLAWAKNQPRGALDELIDMMVYKALFVAIKKNKIEPFNVIVQQKLTLAKQQANDLLWYVVSENKNPAFVQPLINMGADINSVRQGYSLLARAVAHENIDLVKAVAQANPKPNINALHDPSVGTALQIAISLGLSEIDAYLRSQGARE